MTIVSGYSIDKYTLKINDSTIEKDFRHDSLEKSIGLFRYGFASGLFIYAVFCLMDFILLGSRYDLVAMLRFGLIIPILLICLITTFLSVYPRIARVINMLAIISVGMGVILMSLYVEGDFEVIRIFGGLFVVFFCLYSFFIISYRDAIVVGLSLLIAYLYIQWFANGMRSELFYMLTFYLLVTNIIGGSVGYIIEKQRKKEYILRLNLAQNVVKDALTGLHNRHYFNQFLVEDIEEFIVRSKAVRHVERRLGDIQAAKYGLIMVDIDYFKRVNDTFGHHSGDMVLKQFSELLRGHVRQSDDVLRVGGEEFLIVLKLTTEDYLRQFVKEMGSLIENHDFRVGGGSRIGCTASIGLVVIPNQMGDQVEDLIRYVDMALYKSKEVGRNIGHRVFMLQEEVEYEPIRWT